MIRFCLKHWKSILGLLWIATLALNFWIQENVAQLTSEQIKVVSPFLEKTEQTDLVKREKPPPPAKPKIQHRPPNQPYEFGIEMKERPRGGTVEQWENYYKEEYSKANLRNEKTRKVFERVYRSPEEMEKMYADYERKIAETQAILKKNPRDEEAIERLERLRRSFGITKAIASRFDELEVYMRQSGQLE